jgi:arabinogalactan oligomer/maltooligosaccharide transport system substrate-binding protein
MLRIRSAQAIPLPRPRSPAGQIPTSAAPRPLRLTALLAIVPLVAAACGAGGGRNSTGSGSGGPSLTIWTGVTQAKGMQVFAAKWGKANGVKVSLQVVPGPNIQTNFVTAAQAGKGPDLVMGAHDYIGNFVQNGTIAPIQLSDKVKAQFVPQAVRGVTFNGQIYAVPYAVENVVLFRNTALVPQAPTTMEALVATGKRLQVQHKVSEILALPIGQNGDAYHSYPLYTSAGGYLFGKDAKGEYNPKDLGVTKPAAIKAFQRFRSLGERGSGALKRSITSDNVNSLFTDRKTAFMISGPWQIPGLKKAGISYDISPVPGFAGAKPARPFIGVQCMYVASGSRFKALAQEFAMTYWTQRDAVLALYAADPRPPALKTALADVQAKEPAVEKVVSAGAGGDILPAIPEMATIWDPFGKAEAAVVGGADPASTVTAAGKVIASQIK